MQALQPVADAADWVHEKRKRWIEWQEDTFEWLGFFIHRHQNASLMACFMLMWLLGTLSLFSVNQRDTRDTERMGSSVHFSYSHWMGLKPYLGDNLGTPVSHALLFLSGSNAQDGNIITADRMRDVMAYNDMMARGIHICRHKNNGKVKVACNHPMARKFSYENDCYEHQPNFKQEEDTSGELHYMRYNRNAYKRIKTQLKSNFPAIYDLYYGGLGPNDIPEAIRGTEFEWTEECPSCKIDNIKGTLGHCLSENNPFRGKRFSLPEDPYQCSCTSYQYGRPMNISYNGYQFACASCWNTELSEPMPMAMFAHPLMGWQKFSTAVEAMGIGITDGKIYESHARFNLRSGLWKDTHVRKWFRQLYDNPSFDINSLLLGLNTNELVAECGTRAAERAKCVAWKQSTGERYAIGPFGDARCEPLKKYEACVEKNIKAEGILMPYALKIPRFCKDRSIGMCREINPYKNEFMKAYEKEVLSYVVGTAAGHSMAALSHVKPYFLNYCAYGRELGRLIALAIPYFLGGGFLVGVAAMIFMGRIDWIDGRWMLGMFAVFSGTACLFGAFGITVLYGGVAPISAILFLYLVIIAVAVDDMVIIVDEFEKVIPPKDQVQTMDDRIAWKISQALRICGPSITLTTSTTCASFFTGALTGAQSFAKMHDVLLVGFYGFALDYIYQLFFFVPLLLKDEKRRLKSRWGCAPCCCEWPDSAPGTDEDRLTINRGYLSVFCERYLLPVVSSAYMRAAIILSLVITFSISASLAGVHSESVKVATKFSDTWADASYARESTMALAQARKTDATLKPGWFFIKDFNAKSATKRKHLRMFLDHMHYHYRVEYQQDYEMETGENSNRKGTAFTPWTKPIKHNILEKFHNDVVCPCSATDNICPHPLTGEAIKYGPCETKGAADRQSWGPGFTFKDPSDDAVWPPHFIHYYRPTYKEQLDLLLATPHAGMSEQAFTWVNSDDGTKVTYAIRFQAAYPARDSVTATKFYTEAMAIMKSYDLAPFWDRDACYASNFKDCRSYLTIDSIDLTERAALLVGWFWQIILILDATMFGVVACWLPFWGAAFAAFMVFILQVHIFGILSLFGNKFDILCFIALCVTCGICVDEITHCLYHLIYSYGTVEERLHETIVGHGPSIMKGALSTIIGVLMLAGAQSPFWKTFFYIIFSLCVLGSWVGIVVVPCILVTFMQDNPHPDDLDFHDDFDKQQVEMGNIGENGLSIVENMDSHAASSFKSKAVDDDSRMSQLESRVD